MLKIEISSHSYGSPFLKLLWTSKPSAWRINQYSSTALWRDDSKAASMIHHPRDPPPRNVLHDSASRKPLSIHPRKTPLFMTPFLPYELQQEIFELAAQAYPECAPRLALVSSHTQSWYTPHHPMSPDCINIQSIGLNPSYTELSSSASPWRQSNHSSAHFEVDHVPSSANTSSIYILQASSEQTTLAIYCPRAQAHWPSNVGSIPILVYQGCT